MNQENTDCPVCGDHRTVFTSFVSPSFSTVAPDKSPERPPPDGFKVAWQCLRCGHKFATQNK